MFLGSAFLVITSLLFGLLVYWVPDFARPQATFIGVAILAYSSIVPTNRAGPWPWGSSPPRWRRWRCS